MTVATLLVCGHHREGFCTGVVWCSTCLRFERVSSANVKSLSTPCLGFCIASECPWWASCHMPTERIAEADSNRPVAGPSDARGDG